MTPALLERSSAESNVRRALRCAGGQRQYRWLLGLVPVCGGGRAFADRYRERIVGLCGRLDAAGVRYLVMGKGPRGCLDRAVCVLEGLATIGEARARELHPEPPPRGGDRRGGGAGDWSAAQIREWADASPDPWDLDPIVPHSADDDRAFVDHVRAHVPAFLPDELDGGPWELPAPVPFHLEEAPSLLEAPAPAPDPTWEELEAEWDTIAAELAASREASPRREDAPPRRAGRPPRVRRASRTRAPASATTAPLEAVLP